MNLLEMASTWCEKRTFPSQREADGYITELRARERTNIPCRSYRCKRCSYWHLTSASNNPSRKRGKASKWQR